MKNTHKKIPGKSILGVEVAVVVGMLIHVSGLLSLLKLIGIVGAIAGLILLTGWAATLAWE